jgi:hypothetical protein
VTWVAYQIIKALATPMEIGKTTIQIQHTADDSREDYRGVW